MKLSVNADALRNALTSAALSVAKDDTRALLETIHLEVEGDILHIISLDGYRLYHAEIRIINAEGCEDGCGWNIAPVKLPRPKWVNMEITTDISGFMTFVVDGTPIMTRIVPGEYIQWRKIPTHSEEILRIGFDRKYLIDALKQMDDERVILAFGKSIEPVFITDMHEQTIRETAMVLPVRL